MDKYNLTFKMTSTKKELVINFSNEVEKIAKKYEINFEVIAEKDNENDFMKTVKISVPNPEATYYLQELKIDEELKIETKMEEK